MLEDERMGVLWSIITNLNDPGPLNFPLIKDNDSVSTWAVRLQPVFSISSLLWIWDVSSWWLQLILTQGVKVSGRHIIMIIRVTLVTSHLTERWKLSNNSGPKHSSLYLSLSFSLRYLIIFTVDDCLTPATVFFISSSPHLTELVTAGAPWENLEIWLE